MAEQPYAAESGAAQAVFLGPDDVEYAAGGHQLVKTVVSLIFHVVQAFVQFLDGHGPQGQPAEQEAATYPDGDKQHQQGQ